MLKELGKQKTGRVDVVCPGFVGDCLETLEEIAIEGKTIFLKAGGKDYHYIPCLNERDDWIHALDRHRRREPARLGVERLATNRLESLASRALAMGAKVRD